MSTFQIKFDIICLVKIIDFVDKHLMMLENIYWCHSEQDNDHFIFVMFPVFCWYWVTQTWQFGFLCLLMISSHRSNSRKFIKILSRGIKSYARYLLLQCCQAPVQVHFMSLQSKFRQPGPGADCDMWHPSTTHCTTKLF